MIYQTIPYEGELTPENIANLKEWIVALRSGEYKQIKSVLHSQPLNAYCCLGVCSILDTEQVDKRGEKFFYEGNNSPHMTNPDADWFRNRFGISDVIKMLKWIGSEDHCPHFTFINDELDFNFNQIADVIEACFIDRKVIEIEK